MPGCTAGSHTARRRYLVCSVGLVTIGGWGLHPVTLLPCKCSPYGRMYHHSPIRSVSVSHRNVVGGSRLVVPAAMLSLGPCRRLTFCTPTSRRRPADANKQDGVWKERVFGAHQETRHTYARAVDRDAQRLRWRQLVFTRKCAILKHPRSERTVGLLEADSIDV